nr:hypothetical protein [Egicoccus sp.]
MTINAPGYTELDVSFSLDDDGVPTGVVTGIELVSIPRDVEIFVATDEAPTVGVPGIDVTATLGTLTWTTTSDLDGVATFTTASGELPDNGRLVAGTWSLTTLGAVNPILDVTVSRDVPAGSGLHQMEAAILLSNSKLFGVVGEMEDGELVPLEGVTIRADRAGETFSIVSTAMTADGYNYRLRARAGTWKITAIRDGQEIVVDEAFEIVKDGPDTEPNWLDIVLPAIETPVIAGQVLAEGGGGVEGATITATSSAGTVATTTSEDGSYELAGLDDDVTWSVTFTPPEGYEGQPVTRYVAPGYSGGADITLDQTLPSSLGSIQVDLEGGDAGESVAVTLTETTPFPTLDADGTETVMVTLGAEGTASVTFDGLVPDGPGVGMARFSVTAIGEGRDAVSGSAISVAAGQTTAVSLSLGGPTTTVIQVTLTSAGEPVVDRTVALMDGMGTTLESTATPGVNVYTFSGIEMGEWQVTIPTGGFFPGTITVTEGVTDYAVDLVAVEPDPEPTEDPTPEPTESATDGAGGTDTSTDTAEGAGGATDSTEGSGEETTSGTTDGGGGTGDEVVADDEPGPDPEPTATETETVGDG